MKSRKYFCVRDPTEMAKIIIRTLADVNFSTSDEKDITSSHIHSQQYFAELRDESGLILHSTEYQT